MAFKATALKKGLLEIHGLEDFIERKVGELKKALGLAKKSVKKATSRKAAPKKKKAAAKKAPARKAGPAKADPLATVFAALASNPRRAELAKAGKQKDQLLRSLIPLYLVRGQSVEVTSGTTSKFWAKHGVRFAAPNAAKALREHVGYARRSKAGLQITPNGIKYVEDAIGGRRKAA